ncbi:unnamed protein product [Calypogeia fissa]
MDAVRRELERKRKSFDEDFKGRKFVKRSEIVRKELEKIREEDRKELIAKESKSRAAATAATGGPSEQGADTLPLSSIPAPNKGSEIDTDEDLLDEVVLPRAEVIRRLRILKFPITLFGEDDSQRLERLKALLKAGVADTDSELMEGQTNDFLRDMVELRKREKHSGRTEPRKEKRDKERDKELDDGEKDGGAAGELEQEGGSSGLDNDKDMKRLKSNFEELCDEDKILVFFKRLLQEWEQELEDRPEAEKRTGRGKATVATFKQCARYLKPLFKMCRKRMLPDDIRRALMIVVRCCMERDYLTAMDQYIKLAIGNAPWPIGVTMVGIHERSAREKIYTNSVAHIMNDETTRKYLQSIKRLMTLCQRRYPSMPSKSVEFNSLANGSDLQALLAEEKTKTGSYVAEERLRLMAPSSEDLDQ